MIVDPLRTMENGVMNATGKYEKMGAYIISPMVKIGIMKEPADR